jgi:uncharacterized membrane protein
LETSRLEAFSDGVFAIAITLLILEVRLPSEDHATLVDRLGQTWPGYVGFLISFVTIGIMRINHHSIFRLIGRDASGCRQRPPQPRRRRRAGAVVSPPPPGLITVRASP